MARWGYLNVARYLGVVEGTGWRLKVLGAWYLRVLGWYLKVPERT